MTKVLVALDESPTSLRAAREAARLFPNAEVLVVNVIRQVVPWGLVGEFGAVYPVALVDLPVEEQSTDEIVALAGSAGLDDVEVITVEGDPAAAICAAAEAHDVDVVVIGSHHKGMLRRLFDPSVAEAVVHRTHRPVLVVSESPRTA